MQLARIARYRVDAATSTQSPQATVIRVTNVRVTGNGLQHQPLIAYLRDKYARLYQL